MSRLSSKPGTPVVGFNHNLNYKGRVFHVQTEDSGPQHGHIITHIFMGGNILASTKGTYAELLVSSAPGDVSTAVRKLMEDQHKTMIKRLLGGTHDAEITKRTGSDTFYEPGVLANGERAPGLLIGGDSSGPKPEEPPAASSAVATRPDLRPVPTTPISRPPISRPPISRPPISRPPSSAVTSPAVAPVAPSSQPGRARPPAPGALPSSVPRVVLSRPTAPAAVPPVMKPANTLTAPISRPPPASFPPSLPGAHRALDDIILSYLISDLESPRR